MPRTEKVSLFTPAVVAAVLQVVLLTGQVPIGRVCPAVATPMIWRSPTSTPAAEAVHAAQAPSHPVRQYRAGRLALTVGMAVLALTLWLQVMGINGMHGH